MHGPIICVWRRSHVSGSRQHGLDKLQCSSTELPASNPHEALQLQLQQQGRQADTCCTYPACMLRTQALYTKQCMHTLHVIPSSIQHAWQ
jgi:hypothetical protein